MRSGDRTARLSVCPSRERELLGLPQHRAAAAAAAAASGLKVVERRAEEQRAAALAVTGFS